jgi:rubredoxin
MIIYGSKAVHLQSVELPNHSCPSCGTKGSLVMSIFRKHAHIYWIPLFPFGKVSAVQCQHCQLVFEDNKMPQPLWEIRAALKANSKGPIWQFAGLFLIGVFMFWGSRNDAKEQKGHLDKIQNPIAGDVYTYKMDSTHYSTMKVVGVSADSIFVVRNMLAVNNLAGIAQVTNEKLSMYLGAQEGIARTEILNQFNSHKILSVARK